MFPLHHCGFPPTVQTFTCYTKSDVQVHQVRAPSLVSTFHKSVTECLCIKQVQICPRANSSAHFYVVSKMFVL